MRSPFTPSRSRSHGAAILSEKDADKQAGPVQDDPYEEQDGYDTQGYIFEAAENVEDVSFRARIFRDRIIEEFRLEESANFDTRTDPKHSTAELFGDADERARDAQAQAQTGPQRAYSRLLRGDPGEGETGVHKPSPLFNDLLAENPMQLVKFKIFKRSLEAENARALGDKRLARVKNLGDVPIGVWAAWVSQHPVFTWFVFIMILGTAIIQGLQIQMSREDHALGFSIMEAIDDITIIVFILEILVKWVDSFRQFWFDGWNVFDFVITFLSAIPRVISFFGSSESSSFQAVANQLRLFRTMRILKVIARLSSLRVVISTVIEAFQDLGYVLLLLLMLTYIFGIFAINLFMPYTDSTDPGLQFQDKFNDLPNTFITLFQLLTLDQWYSIQEDIQRVVAPIIVICFFVFWVWIGAFIFRNVFVGVMVRKFDEMTAEVNRMVKQERDARQDQRNLQQLRRQLKHVDSTDTLLASKVASASQAQNTHEVRKWQAVVDSTLSALKHDRQEFDWPRDTLLEYLETMEELQNNMREYQELQRLSSAALHKLSEPLM